MDFNEEVSQLDTKGTRKSFILQI